MMVAGPSAAADFPVVMGYGKVDPLAPLAPPPVVAKPSINPALLARAEAALDRHAYIRNRDVIGIADFSLASRDAWYAEPEMVAQHGKLVRSEGCLAFSRDSHHEIMRRLGNGRLIYADKLA